MGMTSDWLQGYLRDCVDNSVCTKINCTTCGAQEFRIGLSKGLGINSTSIRHAGFERGEILKIASALAGIPSPMLRLLAWEKAVRLIIMVLRTGMPNLDREVEDLFVGSWADEVLKRMKEHHQQRLLAVELDSPEKVRERRAAIKLQKQLVHMRRLADKVQWDAAWRSRWLNLDAVV
jgi:hypothetical protein